MIAVASYAAIDKEPGVAEVTVLVEDAWQRHGLGTLLLNRLTSYAVSHGIHTFTAFVHLNNKQILNLVERSGLTFTKVFTHGVWKISVRLPSLEDVVQMEDKGAYLSAIISSDKVETIPKRSSSFGDESETGFVGSS